MPACRVVASLVLVAAAGSCAASEPVAWGPAPLPGVAPRASRDDRAVPDGWIVRALAAEIAASPLVAQQGVGADSRGGVVVLRGSVTNRLARRRAVAIAHVVRGVRAIVDLIEVIPDRRPDDELQVVAARALAVDPVTAGQRIEVRVRSGVVWLSGAVDSPGSAHLADNDLLALPGVKHVVDELTVEATGARTDERLAEEARRLVREDPWLDDAHVEIVASRGGVLLSGWVGVEAQRERAENDVRAASPASVDASRLRVDPWTDSWSLRLAPVRTDAQLAEALTDAYVRDERVHPFVPQIDVHDGVVVLTGVAPNPYAARGAAEDARDLPGVLKVADDVKTLPDVVGASDTAVASEVKEALGHDPALSSRRLSVDVLRGEVYLRGCIASEAERVRALAIGAGVAGANAVEDGLLVGLNDAAVCRL